MQAGGWGQVANADGFRIMAYDVPSATAWNPGEIPFLVSVRGDDADQLTRYWEKLSTGSTIVQPLGPAGFLPLYGMIKDPFGVHSDVSRACRHGFANGRFQASLSVGSCVSLWLASCIFRHSVLRHAP